MKVIITEKQNRQSFRRGDAIEVASLKGAKIAASKRQVYQGTVLTIEDEQGNLLSSRDTGMRGWQGQWEDTLAGIDA